MQCVIVLAALRRVAAADERLTVCEPSIESSSSACVSAAGSGASVIGACTPAPVIRQSVLSALRG